MLRRETGREGETAREREAWEDDRGDMYIEREEETEAVCERDMIAGDREIKRCWESMCVCVRASLSCVSHVFRFGRNVLAVGCASALVCVVLLLRLQMTASAACYIVRCVQVRA